MSVCSTNCSIFRLWPLHEVLLTKFIRFGSDFKHVPVKCRGILIDGDLEKRISPQEEPSPGTLISVSWAVPFTLAHSFRRHYFQGTLPYISINLLVRWTEVYHNPKTI